MSTTTLLTVEQFEQLPDQDGVQFELKDGMLVATANAEWRHEQTKAEILSCLVPHVVQHRLGRVYAETAFAISPSRVYTPDISFLSNESVRKGDPERIYHGAPDLAIEVVSESESAADLREKIQNYLDAGSQAVWAFYPKLRMIAVYDQSGVQEYRKIESWKPLGSCRASRPESINSSSSYYFAAASSSSGTGRPRASATPRP